MFFSVWARDEPQYDSSLPTGQARYFLPFLPPAPLIAGGLKGKKHHFFSKDRRLRRRNVCEGLSICFYPVYFRAESAITFSWLHPEAAKEINPVSPV
jgi:hypothetical protein